MRRRWLALLLISVVFGIAVDALPAHADLKSAVAAYRARNFDKAFEEFSALAKTGDPVAEYNVGVMYLTGRGITRDLEQAVHWHRRAADHGLAVAQYGLGVMYYLGDGVPQDHEEAAKWFGKAARQDYADAQFNLGVMHFNGQGVRRDMSEVVKWISLAAAKDHKDAMYRMATMYEDGSPFRADRDEALRWYRKAAAKGHDAALARADALGDMEQGSKTRRASRLEPAPAPTPAPPTEMAATPSAPPPMPTAAIDEKRQPTTQNPPKTDARQPAQVARAAPAPARPKQPRAAGPGATWTIQLASFRSVDEAKRAWSTLNKRHGGTLGDLAPDYRRVDLGKRGVYHRLRAGPLADRAAARNVCATIRKAAPGQGCLPVPPPR